jgi:hypothetical protein
MAVRTDHFAFSDLKPNARQGGGEGQLNSLGDGEGLRAADMIEIHGATGEAAPAVGARFVFCLSY